MRPKDIALVSKLLDKNQDLIPDFTLTPQNYSQILEAVLLLELEQELTLLRGFLQDPLTFTSNFKQRCQQREARSPTTVPFADLPNTPTNKLIWAIAEKLFTTLTLRDMLAIVLPSITRLVIVDYVLPNNPKPPFEDTMEIILDDTHDFQSLNEFPSLDLLNDFIICGDTILDVREFCDYPLVLHGKLQTKIGEKYPELACKLYQHNTDWQLLVADLLLLNNQGLTPKLALERLAKDLKVGGEKVTNQSYINNGTLKALTHFIFYYQALPEQRRQELNALTTPNGASFANIVENEIGTGSCAEGTSIHIQEILQAHRQSAALNTPPQMLPEDLVKLKARYDMVDIHNRTVISSQRALQLLVTLPEQLAKDVIQRIHPINKESVIDILVNFPANLYDVLFQK